MIFFKENNKLIIIRENIFFKIALLNFNLFSLIRDFNFFLKFLSLKLFFVINFNLLF